MEVLIIEDEVLVARDLSNLIHRLVPDVKIVGELTSVESSKKWFAVNRLPDLILSDIQLSDGISFEIFESIHVNCPIIFTTAYDNFAIRAFKLNSIDYLLKPIDENELGKALEKYRIVSGKSGFDDQVKTLLQQWGKVQSNYKERFLVIQGNSMVPVMQNEIAYFHKDQLIFLHTLKNEKFICEFQALDDIEELLNPSLFFRVNRQCIVHLQAIGKIKTTHKGLSVLLKAPINLEVDISREKASAFKKWLG
jgi:two-component system, LytTR family, response regulator